MSTKIVKEVLSKEIQGEMHVKKIQFEVKRSGNYINARPRMLDWGIEFTYKRQPGNA